MTDFIAYIRQQMDEIGEAKGKALDLIVRVPPTLRDCARVGLDVETWIKEELVDIVIAGGGFIPFETPVDEFVEAAEGTNVEIYGCLEALRPNLNELSMRAAAALYREQGVSGLYLFNYFRLPHEWKRETLGRLVDGDALSRLDKRYEFDKRGRVRPTNQLGFSFQNAIPLTQLPTALEPTVIGPSTLLTMSIADDLEGAKAQGALGECTIGFRLENAGAGDTINVKVNGSALDANAARRSTDSWTRTVYAPNRGHDSPMETTDDPEPGTVIEWTVDTPPLQSGVNEIAVWLTETDSRAGPLILEPLILADVRVSVTYR